MCEVLRALVKCGGLFFMSTNFIRPLIWEVTRLGTANTKVWYFLYHTLVYFAPRLGTANTKVWYFLCHTLVSLAPRSGTANTKVWYFLCHALVSFVPRLVRQILKCGISCITP